MPEPAPAKASNLIDPDDLNLDATVPQCLDDQYVSDRVMDRMLKKKADYMDPEISDLRENEIRTEFLRSLTYSSQLVINRAFFNLNKQLIKLYSVPGTADFNAFATLLSEKKILPFLAKGRSIDDNPDIRKNEDANVALSKLLEKTGDKICCVRLAKDDKTNERYVEFLYSAFGGYLSSLRNLQPMQLHAMAQELFDREMEAREFKRFRTNLYKLADYAYKEGTVRRQKVYEKFFVVPGGSAKEKEAKVDLGRFQEPTRENHLRELKRLVDLRYNTNLPDKLKRYSFTPFDLPTRIALQDDPKEFEKQHSNQEVAKFVEDSLTNLRRRFMADQQRNMYLPLLQHLSLSDIVEIQKLDEWNIFINKQQSVLRHPLKIRENLDDFQNELIKLQTKISDLFKAGKIGATPHAARKYATFITVGLQILGKLLLLGVSRHFSEAVNPYLYKILESGATEATGYTVKLIVNMIDLDSRKIDSDLSYSIDLMRNDNPMNKEDLQDLIRRIESLGGDTVKESRMPDQTKQV